MGARVEPTSSYSFSYRSYSCNSPLDGTAQYHSPPQPSLSESETVPLSLFSHSASTMQALARYLVDVRKLTYVDAARLLGRRPKSLWSSYHQTTILPFLEESIPVPLSIFSSNKSPLEALVLYLRSLGLRNVEIARALRLDPKTIWTVAKRGEAKT